MRGKWHHPGLGDFPEGRQTVALTAQAYRGCPVAPSTGESEPFPAVPTPTPISFLGKERRGCIYYQ